MQLLLFMCSRTWIHPLAVGMQVVAVFGSWHLGQLQVGLSRAIRLAQCHSLTIVASQALPVQIDGEPWQQAPATLHISLHSQVRGCLPAAAASARGCVLRGCLSL